MSPLEYIHNVVVLTYRKHHTLTSGGLFSITITILQLRHGHILSILQHLGYGIDDPLNLA